jgi:alkylation response protein AidB-like acyl-CoA dehydrogenase
VGISRVMDNDMIQKTWTTNDLDDMGFAVWLRNDPQPTGNEDLDRLIVSGMKQVKGFPLKTETVTTTRTWNKKKTKVKDETTMSQTMVVESLEKKKLEPSLFEIPEDYVQGQTPEEQSGLDKFKGMFNQ